MVRAQSVAARDVRERTPPHRPAHTAANTPARQCAFLECVVCTRGGQNFAKHVGVLEFWVTWLGTVGASGATPVVSADPLALEGNGAALALLSGPLLRTTFSYTCAGASKKDDRRRRSLTMEFVVPNNIRGH